MTQFKSTAFALLCLAVAAVAHPGEKHDAEVVKRDIAFRDAYGAHIKRSLDQCVSVQDAAIQERALARRAASATNLRKERGLENKGYHHRRDLAEFQAWEKFSHKSNATFDLSTPETLVFDANISAVLVPEQTIGPYYVHGEFIRPNLVEDQTGIPMHLDMQFIDINTCLPVTDLFIDVWGCNATGEYSGVAAKGQAGLNTTWLRGAQVTDFDGVVQFDTIFPGHYIGRATHEHVVSTMNGTILPNGTYSGGVVNHIGQFYFDEALRAAVEDTYPYSTNTKTVYSNDEDVYAPTGATELYDPFPEYIMLGDDLNDGLFFWTVVGIDTSANYTVNASIASFYYKDGGVNNTNSNYVSKLNLTGVTK